MSKCYVKKENGEVVAFSRNPMEGITTEADTLDSDVIAFLNNGTEIQQAKTFVIEELVWSDIQVNYHDDGDVRAIGTIQDIRDYRVALRNYVQAGAIATAKPSRPS